MLPAELNIEKPDEVLALHRQYAEAGSDVILTNTVALDFIWNQGEIKRAKTACEKGIEIACKAIVAAGASHEVKLGGLISAPFLKSEDPETRSVLKDCLCWQIMTHSNHEEENLIIFETITSISSLSIILECLTEIGPSVGNLPELIFSFSTDKKGLLSGDVDPVVALSTLSNSGLTHVTTGLNCGLSPSFLKSGIRPSMNYFSPSDSLRNPDPEKWAEHISEIAIKSDIKKIGGCCNTTPDHIRALRYYLDRI